MPRYLYLLRHAQSADKQHGQTDRDRVLTTTGMKESLLIAKYLSAQKNLPDLIICSAAQRARATLNHIMDVTHFDEDHVLYDEELYVASTRTFFNIISQLEDNLHHVLCIGHNPTISYLAEYLTKSNVEEFVPAGMAIIQFNLGSWKELSEGNGKLIDYVTPEILANHHSGRK